jgi:hypothetical protein
MYENEADSHWVSKAQPGLMNWACLLALYMDHCRNYRSERS